KDLAHDPLDAVAAHRPRDLLGHRDADPLNVRLGAGQHRHHEVRRVDAGAMTLDQQKVRTPPQAVLAREPLVRGLSVHAPRLLTLAPRCPRPASALSSEAHGPGGYFLYAETARRLRPLARRRLITA